MTGCDNLFAELDTGVIGSVNFDDGLVVDICGRGTVLFTCQNCEHRAINNVYYIPRLKSNVISIGQLDERGCQVLIDGGVLRIHDRQRQLLVKVKRAKNRLYMLN